MPGQGRGFLSEAQEAVEEKKVTKTRPLSPPTLLLAGVAGLCVFLATQLASSLAWAQQDPYSPGVGSIERKAILKALRVVVQKEIKRQPLFKVDHLKVQDQWAFLRGVPQQPGGKSMDYTGTPYQEAIRLGVFDDWICALLRKQRGKWQVVTYVIGATDVAYEGWDKQYQAPPSIFK